MNIKSVTTLRLDEFPNLIWVIVEDEDGQTGTGETFFGARAVEAYIHETAAPLLLGRTIDPESVRTLLRPYVGHQAPGAEMRGMSAIDIALWDLHGKRTGQPLWTGPRWPGPRGSPDVQHMRRISLCAGQPGPAHVELGAWRQTGALRGSRCLPQRRRHAGGKPDVRKASRP